jgi:hypothetical protein
VFFRTSGATLALFPYEELAADVGPAWNVPSSKFTAITLAHNVRERHEVGDLLAQATGAGAEVVKPAGEAARGGAAGISPTRTGGAGSLRVHILYGDA